jgi:quercetin dioxygenase-like cupin family protein
MDKQRPSVIRLDKKLKTVTGRSEYLFHFTSHPVQEDICYFEGFYKDAGPKANLHFHKTMTEIFTVQEGEFTFLFPQASEVLGPGDTIIASPFQLHGFSTNVPDSRMQIISIGFKNRENFFIELSKIANGEIIMDAEGMEAFLNRYDQYTYTP